LAQLKSFSLQDIPHQKSSEGTAISTSLNLDPKTKNTHLNLDSEKETIKEESSFHSLTEEKSTELLIDCKSLDNINFLSEPPGLDKSIKKNKNLMIGRSQTNINPLQNVFEKGFRRGNEEALNWNDHIELISNNNNNVNFANFCGDASKVLFIKGLDEPGITGSMIYNVFSNFGNISKIIFMRNKGGALIEFHSVEYATIAKDFLNNLFFFSNYLKVLLKI
jgi:RNA recognition motif-containing protein